MILYNVTCSVDKDVHEEWYDWMREVHIPDMMKTSLFLETRICRIIAEEEGGISYAVQYLCASEENYKKYKGEFSAKMQQSHAAKYGQKVAAFRTELEVMYQARQTDYSQAQNKN